MSFGIIGVCQWDIDVVVMVKWLVRSGRRRWSSQVDKRIGLVGGGCRERWCVPSSRIWVSDDGCELRRRMVAIAGCISIGVIFHGVSSCFSWIFKGRSFRRWRIGWCWWWTRGEVGAAGKWGRCHGRERPMSRRDQRRFVVLVLRSSTHALSIVDADSLLREIVHHSQMDWISGTLAGERKIHMKPHP